jgi:hypothetical protein
VMAACRQLCAGQLTQHRHIAFAGRCCAPPRLSLVSKRHSNAASRVLNELHVVSRPHQKPGMTANPAARWETCRGWLPDVMASKTL